MLMSSSSAEPRDSACSQQLHAQPGQKARRVELGADGCGECRRGLLRLYCVVLCRSCYRVEGVVGRGDAARVDKDRSPALRCGDEVR